MLKVMKTRTNLVKNIVTCMTILSCLIGIFAPAAVYGAEDDSGKVRVGFYAREGYHEEDDSGTRSGYGYEVLQLMARYTRLEYEYVGYNKTRAEAFEMLRNGEIDILTSVHKVGEGLDEFAFSEMDIGTCNTMMTVKAGNTAIEAGNYETYEGIRVGLMTADVHAECFEKYSQEQGFSYIPVYYNTVAEVVKALEEGEIDAGATASVRVLGDNEWYLESFHEESMYIIVRKEDTELLNTVNVALRRLEMNEPDWRLRLLEKYFPTNKGSILNLHTEELIYLKNLKEMGNVFQVLVNPDRYPYSYIEDGEYKGIMIDVFAHMAGKAGFDYEYIMVEDRKEYVEMLTSGVPDICIDCSDDFSTAENQGYRITDTYLKVYYSWLYRVDHTGVIKKGARLAYSSVKDSVRDMFGDIEYIDFLYDEEAIEAVRNGEVEGYSTNTLHAEKVIWEDEKNELQARVRTNPLNFTIGIAMDTDRRILTILNKAIQNLDEELVEEIRAEYAYLGEKEYTIQRLLNEYPWVVLLPVLLVVLVAVFIVYALMQKKYREEILKEIEATEKANRAKDEFISRMSHDIRTPINGIVGMIEVARRNLDNKERVNDCLVKMFVASKQLGNLVNDVLSVAQITKEAEEHKIEPFNLVDQLEYCKDVINGRLYERKMNFECNFEKIKHPYVIGSEVCLGEILINILGNSVKYTKDGGTIRFIVEEEDGSSEKKAAFKFTMEDTGIGMSEEFLNKIYEPFAQATTSSRTTYEGTGLGMTIVKNLLEEMGGKMDIESRMGEGSKFTLHLEFEIDSTKEAEASQQPEEEEQAADLSGARVLVVDDIELNIEIVQCILEDEGVEVLTAYDGAEAVEVFKASETGSIDMILMDIRMPVMDGIEAARTIRHLDRPDAKTVSIVAMSANSFEVDAEKSIEAGMNRHMNKPVEVDELLKEVAKSRKK